MDLGGLLVMMVEKKASDLFITADWPPSIKVDGKVFAVGDKPLAPLEARDTVYSVMNDRQQKEFEATRECNFGITAKGVGRFRVSAFMQRDAAGMVLRRIESQIPTFAELNLPARLKDLAMLQRGMVIFVGATGTGKSTSLAAVVGYRNRHSTGHIVTVEDPIEFLHDHQGCIITQREVGLDTGSVEVALRNALRQAPDVIMIGEVRTREAMEHAITFSETGQLCLFSLHANNANQALDRIVNFFPEENRQQVLLELSLNLRAIVAQQLIPRPDGRGRRVCVEILLNTPLASDYVRQGEIYKLKDLMRRSAEQGMITFDQDLFRLYKQGEISYADAIRYADSANEVRLMIKLDKDNPDADLLRGLEEVTLVDK
jgi:twitching motility protein PilU